ncbi:CDP-alcohol phosphatidyltransferase family protein [Ornithinimicrobium sp. W1665]|uniref:CDP-alcohol phosphatidyltransferase family protein n=1 Tax=Ornithinimicrobium sp. W1665 TaxID=3416666 RepID=UPI003D6BED6B
MLVVVLGVIVVGALTAGEPMRAWWVVAVAVPAWALDSLDGYVARRTGSASERGARLDSGVDGALVLVMSLAMAPLAPWALVGGLLFPVFLAAQLVRPAWRRTLPRRPSRRIAGGTMTGTLVIGMAPFWPAPLVQVAVAVAVVVVTWSFAVDVRWLERRAGDGRRG